MMISSINYINWESIQ